MSEEPQAMQEVPREDPLWLAWLEWQKTSSFKNARLWALRIMPMLQAGEPNIDRIVCELMPLEQRERHVEGALWNAFVNGWNSRKVVNP